MKMLKEAGNPCVLAEVLLYEEKWDEAVQLAEGRDVWHEVVELVVDGVMSHRAEWAAKMSIGQAERLMVDAHSKNYPIAVAWLQRAKRAYQLLGQSAVWETYLVTIKQRYNRRRALQAQLQRL